MADRQSHAESLEGASAQVDMVGKFLYEISTRHSKDKTDCSIKSSVLLPGGRLAVVDSNNECVKLFDLEARKLTSKVKLSSWPRDITAIGVDRLAVVFNNGCYRVENKQRQYDNKAVPMLRMNHKLARSISLLSLTGRSYKGVTCQEEKLYLLCEDPPSIQICDLDGTLLNQIDLPNNKGRWLFESIAVSPDGAHIYVSYWNKVVCLTTKGQEVWTFDCDFYKGMDVDIQGRLFMCGYGSNPPIKILSSAGRPGTLLLDREVEYSRTVAVGDGRMCLGRDDKIFVFDLQCGRRDLCVPPGGRGLRPAGAKRVGGFTAT